MMNRGLVISLVALVLGTASVAYVIHARSWVLYSLEGYEDLPMIAPEKPALAPGTR